MANKIVKENMSVRALEDEINNNGFEKKVTIKRQNIKDKNHLVVQNVMREKIGTMVKVNNRNIVIPFDNDKDLERILEILDIKINLD